MSSTSTNNRRLICGLYAIADSAWNPCASLPELVGLFLHGGCRLIQLRMKGSPADQVFDVAREVMRWKKEYDFTFIVNDHPHVAAELKADGVHVGSNDLSVPEIRRRYGQTLCIGYSAHSVEEVITACEAGVDYVAFGALFPTKTKGGRHPVQGIDRLRQVIARVDVPLVAIGGITRHNVDAVVASGVPSVAMITALSEAEDVVRETRWFVERLRG